MDQFFSLFKSDPKPFLWYLAVSITAGFLVKLALSRVCTGEGFRDGTLIGLYTNGQVVTSYEAAVATPGVRTEPFEFGVRDETTARLIAAKSPGSQVRVKYKTYVCSAPLGLFGRPSDTVAETVY